MVMSTTFISGSGLFGEGFSGLYRSAWRILSFWKFLKVDELWPVMIIVLFSARLVFWFGLIFFILP